MKSPASIPFKSKKPIQSTTPKSKSKLLNSDAIATQTPDKPPSDLPSCRLRNRGVALSVHEVRKIAQSSSSNNNDNDNRIDGGERIFKSARRQISSWLEESSNKSMELERNEMLSELFDCLDSSIQLLKLKGSMPTFTNICPKIECLTDRRFSHGHLAQMKHILPEVIEIKRVLVFDERTSCMKPDLHVSLNLDAIEFDGTSKKSQSKNLYLRKVFRARLQDFYKSHPEGDEIPEALLPEPFNRSKLDFSSDRITTGPLSSITETSTHSNTRKGQLQAVASHFSKSFTRRFSQKITNTESDDNGTTSPNICSQQSELSVPKSGLDKISFNEESSAPTDGNKSSAGQPTTPCKDIEYTKIGDSSTKATSFQSTPAKLVSTPAKLMSSTPALHQQRRCFMSPDDDDSSNLADKLVRRPVRTRSLKFESPLKNVKDRTINDAEDASACDDDDILKILPESLLQSIREKERMAQEERDPAISQAKRRRQMIASLPKLFNMMHFLFQSIRRSVITKEELMHKIIAGHSDIVDRRELEEQLELLLELVPEWISKKFASSGDSLFCINKMSNPETIRARLEEAK